jgi:hypothetical protein
MRFARVFAVLTYVAAIAVAASEAGWAVGSLVAIVGAAFLALAYVAAGDAGELLDRAPRRATRRRRRA